MLGFKTFYGAVNRKNMSDNCIAVMQIYRVAGKVESANEKEIYLWNYNLK